MMFVLKLTLLQIMYWVNNRNALSIPGVGKLSSEKHLSLWNALSCPRSRQLSLVPFKGDYASLALRNYKLQAEKHYSCLIIVKLLTPFRSMKHCRDSLKIISM